MAQGGELRPVEDPFAELDRLTAALHAAPLGPDARALVPLLTYVATCLTHLRSEVEELTAQREADG